MYGSTGLHSRTGNSTDTRLPSGIVGDGKEGRVESKRKLPFSLENIYLPHHMGGDTGMAGPYGGWEGQVRSSSLPAAASVYQGIQEQYTGDQRSFYASSNDLEYDVGFPRSTTHSKQPPISPNLTNTPSTAPRDSFSLKTPSNLPETTKQSSYGSLLPEEDWMVLLSTGFLPSRESAGHQQERQAREYS